MYGFLFSFYYFLNDRFFFIFIQIHWYFSISISICSFISFNRSFHPIYEWTGFSFFNKYRPHFVWGSIRILLYIAMGQHTSIKLFSVRLFLGSFCIRKKKRAPMSLKQALKSPLMTQYIKITPEPFCRLKQKLDTNLHRTLNSLIEVYVLFHLQGYAYRALASLVCVAHATRHLHDINKS